MLALDINTTHSTWLDTSISMSDYHICHRKLVNVLHTLFRGHSQSFEYILRTEVCLTLESLYPCSILVHRLFLYKTVPVFRTSSTFPPSAETSIFLSVHGRMTLIELSVITKSGLIGAFEYTSLIRLIPVPNISI